MINVWLAKDILTKNNERGKGTGTEHNAHGKRAF